MGINKLMQFLRLGCAYAADKEPVRDSPKHHPVAPPLTPEQVAARAKMAESYAIVKQLETLRDKLASEYNIICGGNGYWHPEGERMYRTLTDIYLRIQNLRTEIRGLKEKISKHETEHRNFIAEIKQEFDLP